MKLAAYAAVVTVLLAGPAAPAAAIAAGASGQVIIAQALAITVAPAASAWKAAKAPLPRCGAATNASPALSDVACPSVAVCVAVGSYGSGPSGYGQGLLLTRSGSSWTATEAPLPAGTSANRNAELSSVACPSAAVCVAGQRYTDSSGHGQGVLLTGHGSSWAATKAPLPRDAARRSRDLIRRCCLPIGRRLRGREFLHRFVRGRAGTAGDRARDDSGPPPRHPCPCGCCHQAAGRVVPHSLPVHHYVRRHRCLLRLPAQLSGAAADRARDDLGRDQHPRSPRCGG